MDRDEKKWELSTLALVGIFLAAASLTFFLIRSLPQEEEFSLAQAPPERLAKPSPAVARGLPRGRPERRASGADGRSGRTGSPAGAPATGELAGGAYAEGAAPGGIPTSTNTDAAAAGASASAGRAGAGGAGARGLRDPRARILRTGRSKGGKGRGALSGAGRLGARSRRPGGRSTDTGSADARDLGSVRSLQSKAAQRRHARDLALLASLEKQVDIGEKNAQYLQDQRAADDAALDEAAEKAAAEPWTPPPEHLAPLRRGKFWPVKGRISQNFGCTNFAAYPPGYHNGKRCRYFHGGLDIAQVMGTPMRAFDAGQVVAAGYSKSYGNHVMISHPGGMVTVYAHMGTGSSGPRVRAGQYVNAGQTVGEIGMTGMTTGPHIHFEVRAGGERVDPLRALP